MKIKLGKWSVSIGKTKSLWQSQTSRNVLKNFDPLITNPKVDSIGIEKLRARSRQLIKSNPIASGAINTMVSYAIGDGLELDSQILTGILNISQSKAREYEEKIQEYFKYWAGNAKLCDTNGQDNFYALQRLALRSMLASGDVFALLQLKETDGIGTTIKLVEADLVGEKLLYDIDTIYIDNNKPYGGIAVNSSGAPIGYSFYKRHPFILSNTVPETTYVSKYARSGRLQVIHVFQKGRPNELRGYPLIAPALESILQVHRYTESELTAALISSFFSVILKQETSPLLDENQGALEPELNLGPMGVSRISNGDSIQSFQPNRPNTNFSEFIEAIIKQVGQGIGIPYEVLTKNYQSSYSASRAALKDAELCFLNYRKIIEEQFCKPIFMTIITEMVEKKILDLPGFLDPSAKGGVIRNAFLNSKWIGKAIPHLDPLKEAKASAEMVRSHLSTRQQETQGLGKGSFFQNAEQLRAEEQAIRNRRNNSE